MRPQSLPLSANYVNKFFAARNARRQFLVSKLRDAGARPVLEAILEVESGHSVDAVLERFAAIPAATYHKVGADRLAIDSVAVIDGGRA